MEPMNKQQAISLLGGSKAKAAKAVGISYQAVNDWPEELPQRIEDRVLAVLARQHLPPEMLQAAGATPASDAAPADQAEQGA